ncbi:hypothetical protein RhiirC2_738068 [Rhizophagus irregularis]|uniref:Uncharacterized protein n=1 Tax=Rhizophagus irregularis TaxID=588596 RepID=A0A2N1NLS5_9GLOM|nr:hypothetical protein RhiirC2_738068 [Rhizophagus irregularis]
MRMKDRVGPGFLRGDSLTDFWIRLIFRLRMEDEEEGIYYGRMEMIIFISKSRDFT